VKKQSADTLFSAIAGAQREIKIRHIGNCLKADPAYGKEMTDAIGIPLSDVPKG
jgi:catalase